MYRIKFPLEAEYGKPFRADVAFTMIEAVKEIVELDHDYEVLRGEKIVGTVSIKTFLGA